MRMVALVSIAMIVILSTKVDGLGSILCSRTRSARFFLRGCRDHSTKIFGLGEQIKLSRLRMQLSGNGGWTRAQYARPQKAASGGRPTRSHLCSIIQACQHCVEIIKLTNRFFTVLRAKHGNFKSYPRISTLANADRSRAALDTLLAAINLQKLEGSRRPLNDGN